MANAEKKTREELQADGELLVIRLKAIGYALYVVESANALVNALLERQPVAQVLRRLITELQDFNLHIVPMENYNYAEQAGWLGEYIATSQFQKAEIVGDDLELSEPKL